MPVLLILGPIFGIALVALVARGHRSPVVREATAPIENAQQIELDRGMPDAVVHRVLPALVHSQDPAELEALARELGGKYPLAARELQAKAGALKGPAHEVASPPPRPSPPSPSAASPRARSSSATASPDMSEPALVLQAAMTAFAHETDPVSLEGFAASIRAKYPTATILLLGRAQALRAAEASPEAAPTPVPTNAPAPLGAFGSPAVAPGPPKPTTYEVQAGDTPTHIAERLTHDANRWPDLVAANPEKPTTPDGTFASLRPGETLNLPPSWSARPMVHRPASAPSPEVHS